MSFYMVLLHNMLERETHLNAYIINIAQTHWSAVEQLLMDQTIA